MKSKQENKPRILDDFDDFDDIKPDKIPDQNTETRSYLSKETRKNIFYLPGYQSLAIGFLVLVCSVLIWTLYGYNHNRYSNANRGVLAFLGGASLYISCQSITEGLKKINKSN